MMNITKKKMRQDVRTLFNMNFDIPVVSYLSFTVFGYRASCGFKTPMPAGAAAPAGTEVIP
jgi:hypothetical protein